MFTNGDIVKSKVIEIGQTEVKYKKASNTNGPIYSINKADIFSITYDNGEKEIFEESPHNKKSTSSNADSQNTVSVATPADDNKEMISKYNKFRWDFNDKKVKNGFAKEFLVSWYFTHQSVLSSKDVKISFERVNFGPRQGNLDSYEYSADEYQIKIKNCSDQPIFIDLSNTMRIDFDSTMHPFYTGGFSTIQGGNGTGGGLNLGSVANALNINGIIGTVANGVTINKNKHDEASITVGEQQFLTILPNGTLSLPPRKVLNKKKTKTIDHFEHFRFGNFYQTWDKKVPKMENLMIKKNEVRRIDPVDIPFSIKYYITYSTDRNFENSFVIPIELYPGVIDAAHGSSLLIECDASIIYSMIKLF